MFITIISKAIRYFSKQLKILIPFYNICAFMFHQINIQKCNEMSLNFNAFFFVNYETQHETNILLSIKISTIKQYLLLQYFYISKAIHYFQKQIIIYNSISSHFCIYVCAKIKIRMYNEMS